MIASVECGKNQVSRNWKIIDLEADKLAQNTHIRQWGQAITLCANTVGKRSLRFNPRRDDIKTLTEITQYEHDAPNNLELIL